jgi:NADPH:quinone reductase-like Zn-dependent oxidoreductase
VRALQFAEFGGPDKLHVVDLADPAPSAGQAVVKIMAASVNPSDVKNVAGQMEGTSLPRVPGRDFSGIVEHGPAEWLGAEVWGTGGTIGFSEDGTHAEFITFPVTALVRKPASLNHAEASAIGVNFIAAWLGLMDYAAPLPGETLVVVGIGGGVGGATAQIAKAKGCRIIGVDRQAPVPDSPAGQAMDSFIPSDSDVGAAVRDLTGGNGANIVYDTVGGVMFEAALAALGHRGRLIEISSTGKRRVEFDLIDFYHKEAQLFGADSRKVDALASARIFTALAPGFDSGHYKAPVIAERHRLDQGQDAYRSVQNGTRGRVVIAPQADRPGA